MLQCLHKSGGSQNTIFATTHYSPSRETSPNLGPGISTVHPPFQLLFRPPLTYFGCMYFNCFSPSVPNHLPHSTLLPYTPSHSCFPFPSRAMDKCLTLALPPFPFFWQHNLTYIFLFFLSDYFKWPTSPKEKDSGIFDQRKVLIMMVVMMKTLMSSCMT